MSAGVPSGWAQVRLEELVTFNPRHPQDLDDGISVSFVPMAAVGDSRPDLELTQERPLGDVRKGFTHFADGDVLFAKITPCMENGKGGVARGLANGIGCGTTELVVMRPQGAIEPNYLYRYLAQPRIRAAAKEHFTGTAGQARVPLSFLQKLEIPLAPLAEQRRIVNKLEHLLARVEVCQSRLAKTAVLLDRFRKSVLAAACSGQLTADWRIENPDVEPVGPSLAKSDDFRKRSVEAANIKAGSKRFRYVEAARIELGDKTKGIDDLFELPDTWVWASLGQLTWSVADGPHFSPKYVDPERGVPFISGRNVSYGGIDFSDAKYVSRADHDEFSRRARPLIGDVLITKGGTTGVATVVTESREFSIWVHVALLKVVTQLASPFYLRDVLSAPFVYRQSQAQTHGVGNQDLGLTRMVHMALPLPPKAEQEEIVLRVSKLFGIAARLEARLEGVRALLGRLPTSLLDRAFAGELVQVEAELARCEDREYESATALLARVRREKSEDAAPPKAGVRKRPEREVSRSRVSAV